MELLEQEETTFVLEVGLDQQLPRYVWSWLVKYRANFTCDECGYKWGLHAHHTNGIATDNRLSNGQCVCQKCHTIAHVAARAKLREESPEAYLSRQREKAHRRKLREAESAQPPGFCGNCGRQLVEGTRKHAKYCGGACRAEASRKRRGLN